jgi:hypothetical protein
MCRGFESLTPHLAAHVRSSSNPVVSLSSPLFGTGGVRANDPCPASPDGSKILFHRLRGDMDIWMMDPDGTDQEAITKTPEDEFGASF